MIIYDFVGYLFVAIVISTHTYMYVCMYIIYMNVGADFLQGKNFYNLELFTNN